MSKDLNKSTIIVCEVEGCKAEFLASSIVRHIESVDSADTIGVKRSYFTCPKCGYKYTIDVTDTAMRLKIKAFKLLYKKQRNLLAKGAGEERLKNNYDKLMACKYEIVNRGAELKRKWL